MKKLLLSFSLMMAFSGISFSQKLTANKVPQVVKDGLKTSHPGVTATWEWEDANYEANFKEGGKSLSCIVDKGGNILETETMVNYNELPAAAKTYINTHFKNAKWNEIARIQKAGGEINYEVVRKGEELMFDANGKYLELVKEKKEKD